MALETATYINDLVSTNPVSTDGLAQADDHLRLIKQVLKNSFPGLTGAVGATGQAGLVPSGGIMLWSGTVATIPAGWALCNGLNGTPNLQDKFILGAGTTAAGTTGGSVAITPTVNATTIGALTGDTQGAHSHTGATGSHVLTLSEIPPHDHSLTGISVLGSPGSGGLIGNGGSPVASYPFASAGGGTGHTHTISVDGAHAHTVTVPSHTHTAAIADGRPPFYALAFIMKL